MVRVLWILRVEVPEAERMELGVTAREKMSVLWAGYALIKLCNSGGGVGRGEHIGGAFDELTIVDCMGAEVLFRL